MIGRPLRSDEAVHHINGDRTDDRPENLQVMPRGQHGIMHQERFREQAPDGYDLYEVCEILGMTQYYWQPLVWAGFIEKMPSGSGRHVRYTRSSVDAVALLAVAYKDEHERTLTRRRTSLSEGKREWAVRMAERNFFVVENGRLRAELDGLRKATEA